MAHKKNRIVSVTLVVLALVFIVIFYFMYFPASKSTNVMGTTTTTTPSYEYTEMYSDPTYHFSFRYPQGFVVTVVGDVGGAAGETILVQSSAKEAGVQMLVSPYGPDVDITEALIHQDIPDL